MRVSKAGMKYVLLRTCTMAWIVVSGLSCYAFDPCPAREELQTALQQLMANLDPRGQVGTLQNWQRRWKQCNYPTDSTYVDGLLRLGLAYQARYEYKTATQIVLQAVELCRMRRPAIRPDQLSKALFRLGTLLTDQRQPAMETLKQAIRQGQGIRSADRWVSGAYLDLAFAYYSAGDFQQAINSAENGELVASRAKDKVLLTKLLQEKIKSLNELGQYEAAHQAAERALALSKQEGYTLVIARAYQALGRIAEKQNRFNEAIQYTLRALAIARANDDVAAPNYSTSVGMLYAQLHQYNKAISYYHYGFDHNTNAYDKAYALTMLGQVYAQKKEYAKAIQYYHRGLLMIPIGFRNTSVTSLPNPQSIQIADQKEYLLTLIRSKAYAWLSSVKVAGQDRRQLQQALATYQVADQMIDFMRWEQTGQQSKLYWRQTTRNIYEQAIETCYRLGNTQQAFRFMEKSRAVMLTDKLNELGARQKLTEQQIKQEEQLQQAVSDQQSELVNVAPKDSVAYQTARMELSNKQDSLVAFRKRLGVSNPAYYGYKYDTTTASLVQLQSYLKHRKASFVTYFVGDSMLYVFGVTPNKATLYRQPLRTYQRDIQVFMKLVADPNAVNRKTNYDQFLALGNSLYKRLLAPLNLPTGSVIVSPDGSFVPFETLSRNPDEADYLVHTYAFSYIYSARLLLKKRDDNRVETNERRDFLGVAPVNFAPYLHQDRLPNSDTVLEPIAGRFGSSLLLTHGAATRRAFLTQAPSAHVIHLFTHAVADSTQQEPRLYFADSTLQLADLEDNALLRAELVVLAACKTGIGANQRGEGVFSLARGFAALGVPSVLTTLWSVENQATYQLSDLFYQYIDQGLPKDVALQKAKQDWYQSAEGRSQLPTYWAGLIIVGDAEPLSQTHYRWWLAGGGLLLIGGLGGWWFRRRRQAAHLRL